MKLHSKKCHFAQPEVVYLGHVISSKGIRPDLGKVRAVENFPIPTSVKEVKRFLGMASYYRRFVPNFAKSATPLHSLTRQDVPFLWTRKCEESFQKLKDCLISPPVLAYPKFDLPFTLHTDASGDGLGAVLEQEDNGQFHPIAYASRTVSKHEKNYGITELEALGVVKAVKHFRPYLFGHRCTDHSLLRSMLMTQQPSGKLARWGIALAELDLEIKYRPGRVNAHADALSSPSHGPRGEFCRYRNTLHCC